MYCNINFHQPEHQLDICQFRDPELLQARKYVKNEHTQSRNNLTYEGT